MGLVNAAVRENPSPDTMMADRDKEWRETLPAWTTPFMTSVLDNPLSSSLRERFITFYQRESGYSVFESLFITDLRGGGGGRHAPDQPLRLFGRGLVARGHGLGRGGPGRGVR